MPAVCFRSKIKKALRLPGEPEILFDSRSRLVCAPRKQRHQHHQIRQGEKPLVGLYSRSFRGPGDKTQVPAFREVVQVIYTNPCKGSDLGIGEYLLARFNGNHGALSFSPPYSADYQLDAVDIVKAAPIEEQ